MNLFLPSSRRAEALARAGQHGLVNRLGTRSARSPYSPSTPFSIAISRQVGTRGTSVAHVVGKLLNWPVYDQELLQRVAHEMHLPSDRVALVDEKPMSWLQERFETLSSAPQVTEDAYVHHLLATLFLLGARGKCVIVGRGAARALPLQTTLRVRLIAPLEDRIEVMRRELGVSREEAQRHVESTDRERAQFIRTHFLIDTAEPQYYDLVLNSSRFSAAECAALVVEGLRKLQALANPRDGGP
jgi:cytidylate kinase